MTQRFYFDTSVFGGVFDSEFDEISATLFEKVTLGQIICVYSDLSENELSRVPQKIQDFFKSLPGKYLEYVEVSQEALNLAQTYIAENVVGKF